MSLSAYRKHVPPEVREEFREGIENEEGFDPMNREHLRALRRRMYAEFMAGNIDKSRMDGTNKFIEACLAEIAYDMDEHQRLERYDTYQPGTGHLRDIKKFAKDRRKNARLYALPDAPETPPEEVRERTPALRDPQEEA